MRYWASQSLPEEFMARIRQNLKTVLDQTNTSLRLLREPLTAELAKIDRQEENLLDLAADAALAADKVRTRLTHLQADAKGSRSG